MLKVCDKVYLHLFVFRFILRFGHE